MQITGLSVHQVDLPLHEGSYNWSEGKSVAVFDSTVVGVHTDTGLTGWGEVCPLGPFYLPAYASGARAGLRELGPSLLGLDPRDLDVLNRRMDRTLKGHPYVKSAVDMACWDLLGKDSGQPAARLLGGAEGEDFVLYRAISQEAPDAMAAFWGWTLSTTSFPTLPKKKRKFVGRRAKFWGHIRRPVWNRLQSA